jgi:hypothetical protein
VILYQSSATSTTVDAEGVYIFKDVDASQALLIYKAPGYQTQEKRVELDDFVGTGTQPNSDQIPGSGLAPFFPMAEIGSPLPQGNAVEVAPVYLRPMDVNLSGVVQAQGVPRPGVEVRISSVQSLVGGGQSTIPLGVTTTDNQGNWSFTGLPFYNTYTLVVPPFDLDGDLLVDTVQVVQTVDYFNSTLSGILLRVGDFLYDLSGILLTVYGEPVSQAPVYLLDSSSQIAKRTTTDGNGRWLFTGINNRLSASYSLFIPSRDLNGDGIPDTSSLGPLSINSANWGNKNWVLRLNPVGHNYYTNVAINGLTCTGGLSNTYLDGSDRVYIAFDTSVDRSRFEVLFYDNQGNRVAVNETWVDQVLVSYLPTSGSWQETSGQNDRYTMEIRSLVFADGFMVVDPQGPDRQTCYFRVGVPPIYLPSPSVGIYMDPLQGGVSYEVEQDVVRVLNARGNVVQTYNSGTGISLQWTHINGAQGYNIYVQDTLHTLTNGNDITGRWIRLAQVTNFNLNNNSTIVFSVNPWTCGACGAMAVYPSLGGPPYTILAGGNALRFVVKPFDPSGHEGPISPGDPVLELRDTQPARLTNSAMANTTTEYGPVVTKTVTLFFNDIMDPDFPAPLISAGSGVAFLNSLLTPVTPSLWSPQWLPQNSNTPNNLRFNNLIVQVNLPPVTQAASSGNNDNILDATELGSSADLSRIQVGMTLGIRLSAGPAIVYRQVQQFSSVNKAIVLNGGFVGTNIQANDPIFDPRSSYSTLSVTAVQNSTQIQVMPGEGSRFYRDQDITIYDPLAGTWAFNTISAIAGDTLTLTGVLFRSYPAGTIVVDSNAVEYAFRGVIDIQNANNQLIQPLTLSSSSGSFDLRNTANLNSVAIGDRLLFDGDCNVGTIHDQAEARVTQMDMVDPTGGTRTDGNGNAIYTISYDSLVPLGTTTFPLTLDPATSCIRGMGDSIAFTAGVRDSSGNAGVSSRARKINLFSLFVWGD